MGRTKQYQRDQVIEASLGVFLQKGFFATSLTDLTAATGLNKKSLYNEFESKEGLFQCALELFIQKRRQVWGDLLTQEPLGIPNIARFFEHLANTLAHNSTGCLMALSLNEANLISPQSLATIEYNYARIESIFAHNLQASAQQGLIPESQVPLLAKFLLNSLMGLSTFIRLKPAPEALQGIIQHTLNALSAAQN